MQCKPQHTNTCMYAHNFTHTHTHTYTHTHTHTHTHIHTHTHSFAQAGAENKTIKWIRQLFFYLHHNILIINDTLLWLNARAVYTLSAQPSGNKTALAS